MGMDSSWFASLEEAVRDSMLWEGDDAMRDVLRAQLRILTFRFDTTDLRSFDSRHLSFGLAIAWVAGLGRYWDHPDPYLVQSIGLGSVLIPITLSGILYGMLYPLRPERWSYIHLLTGVSLTSLPALLYAIPVERFLVLPTARSVNVWFLGTVAVWRVALLGTYLYRSARMSPLLLPISLLLPLALIVTALAMLNLERAVFDLMAGMREDGTANDAAYGILVIITTYSFLASPFLLASYVLAIALRRRSPRTS